MKHSEALRSRYEILERLDTGSRYSVYRLLDKHNPERELALKRVSDEFLHDIDCCENIRKDYICLRLLAHEKILSVYDFINQSPCIGYTMKLIEGKSLRDRLAPHGTSDYKKMINHLCQVLEALSFIHEHGYVHGGLTMSKLLYDADTTSLILSDFSTMFEAGDLPDHVLYKKERNILPPEYIDRRDYDARSDLYTLGHIAYELLTGRCPFAAATQFEKIVKQIKGTPEAPELIRSEIPVSLSKTIMKAMSSEPDDRYQTAEEFMKALKTIRL